MYSEADLSALLTAKGFSLKRYREGEGGSALVHRAYQQRDNFPPAVPFGRDVAVKEYKDEVVAKKEQLDRIRQEVQVGQVHHPNVVGIHTLIEVESGAPLLIMDWVDGMPLDQWCDRHEFPADLKRDPSQWDLLRKVAIGLVDGLAELHKAGIKHRDLKPANVFVTKDGTPVLMDMGVVEVASNDESTLNTNVRDFIGTVRYAAPQFIRGEAFDFADDVYALGATLYRVVTGKEVFAAVERKPLLPFYILTERQRVGEVAAGIPPQVSVLIEGALHPDRHRRPTIAETSAFLQDPEKASYIQRELDARNKERRGFAVVAIYDQGATVLADVVGKEPERGDSYCVVRELKAVKVPSLGGEAKPEKWIADVELKHVHNGVGHFAVQKKKWVPGKSTGPLSSLGLDLPSGHWEESEKVADVPRVGDVVVEPAK